MKRERFVHRFVNSWVLLSKETNGEKGKEKTEAVELQQLTRFSSQMDFVYIEQAYV